MTFPNRLLGVLILVSIVLVTYFLLARPYQLHWGATGEEVKQPMPGDELNLKPTFLATRAITSDGKPEEVWPWLVQMGYKRVGFYGYDIFENLGSPGGIASAQSILPESQGFKVGDEVPISPAGGLVFYAIESNRYLIWSGDKGWGGFTWALYPLDSNHTRLISRVRWSYSWNRPGQLAFDLFTEFSDHLAVRKILQGIKGRVEGRIEPKMVGTVEFLIYLASALIFLTACVLILLCPFTWQGWLAGLAAGFVWLITWYAPLPVWVGAILGLLTIWGLTRFFWRRPDRIRPHITSAAIQNVRKKD
jgi:hypothetical protein